MTQRARVLVVLLSLAVAAPGLAGSGAGFDSWCSVMSTGGDAAPGREPADPSFLDLRQARYDVDVLGSLAIGSLTLEFFNGADEARRVRFSDRVPAGVQVDSMRLQVGDAKEADWIELPLPAKPQPPAARNPQPRGQPAAPARVDAPTSVPAGTGVTVHTRFRTSIPFREHRFRLLLPAIGGECAGLVKGWPERGAPAGTLGARVRVHADRELMLVESPTHQVHVAFEETHSLVELVADPYGDRSLAVDFALGQGREPALTAFAAPAVDGEREVVVVLSPAVETVRESVRPKELLFVLDTSGSMHGEKIAKAVAALGACLEQVTPQDLFNVVRFNYEFALLHPEPVAGQPTALSEAQLWLSQQRTGGNTKLFPALEAVLEQPHEAEHHRLVVIVSDGKLGDSAEVEAFLTEHLGEARLFLVGIGEDANEQEILRLAQLGRGTAVFARDAGQLEAAITELFGGIAEPVAWDLRLHWGEAQVLSMEPRQVPDLYAGRPVTITARVRGELPPDLLVEASTMDGVRVFQTALPAGGAPEFDQIQRSGK